MVNPRVSYFLRASIRGFAFPFRPRAIDSSPHLRDDFAKYSDLYHGSCANFEKVVSPYQAEIQWSPGRVYNGLFETIDAELYHCMVRFLQPEKVIEVGAGNSTWFAREALRLSGGGQLVAIAVRSRPADVSPFSGLHKFGWNPAHEAVESYRLWFTNRLL